MAGAGVLEKSEKRAYLDDTTPLSVSIVTNRVVPKQNYVEYVMRVQRGPVRDEYWEIRHRYSDFAALAAALQPHEAANSLPPKKMFGTTDQQFVAERQQGLEQFLSTILSDPLVRNSMEVKRFLDPSNYSCNFFDRGLQNVSMFFRSEPSWRIVEPMRDMGWRIRKQHFIIGSRVETKQIKPHLLTRCEHGPDFSIGLKEMKALLKVLKDIQHPFILSPVSVDIDDTGLLVVRPFMAQGSLKDAIYGKSPKGPALVKYGQAAPIRRVSVSNIRLYGRQILEALNFLSERSFVMGQIHAGNVLLCEGGCKLVDIENTLMGVPSQYRHFLVEIKKIRSHAGETVYSFGQMLYEMLAGTPLNKASINSCPNSFPTELAQIIESILTPKAFKEGLPTISDLLKNSFFAEGLGAPQSEKPVLRVPSKLRDVLKAHLEKAELRLFNEQKKVAQHQRLSKAHENLMSEDEKKKRLKQRKKQMSLQEEEGPQAYPTTTSLPRQNTIGTSGITHSSSSKKQSSTATPTTNGTPSATNTNSSNSKNAPTKSKSAAAPAKAPPPPSATPPEPRPPPSRASSERGALLGSIEGFAKGKLKKTKTNDRSAPKL